MPEYRHTWNIIYMTVWIQTRFIFDLLSITFHSRKISLHVPLHFTTKRGQ